eukprot:8771849-Heterocapsa_arctica.AAC.1
MAGRAIGDADRAADRANPPAQLRDPRPPSVDGAGYDPGGVGSFAWADAHRGNEDDDRLDVFPAELGVERLREASS